MARRNAAEVATGAVVILLAAGFLAYAVAHSGRGAASGYPLIAKFEHIDGLFPGADVRVAGVKVGSVEASRIDPSSFLAVVTFTVADAIKLPRDSSAEITSDGLLGSKYLSLVPGGDTSTLKPGQEVTITQGSISIEQLLGKFIFSVSSMKPSQGGSNAPANPPADGAAPK
jgi:phospholipid/cholesterol/gamma-HCH transport system substrate-binding protein